MKKFHFNIRERSFGERFEQELEGFKVVYLPTLVDFYEQPFMPSLIEEISLWEPEIVHVHEDFQNCSFLALLAARKKSIPLVLSEERYYFPEGLRILPYSLYSSTLAGYVRQKAVAITAHSSAAREFLASLGVERERITVVPVGIDPREFKPTEGKILVEKAGISGDDIILTVARLHRNKGLVYLLKAMSMITCDHPESRLIIVGGGPLEGELREQISKLKLERYVVLVTEPIPNKEMAKTYSICDVFVLPSIKEPFGRVILEAMACEKPIVATRVGGPSDIVKDGRTGYLVEKKDPSQLASRICELLQDKKMARRFGKSGRRQVLEIYDWKRIVERYIEIYEAVQSRA